MIGKAIAVIAQAIAEIARLARLKLRSRNSDSGTNGSRGLRACQPMNTANISTPPMISKGTEIGPTMVPQSNWWPSWMPNTRRNIATPDRATPHQSKLWLWVGSVGTSRHARTRATTPTGMLMKKIHSQPSASTSTPPRIGPTSVATPAVAPHSAIAWPRRSEGKMRVMIAIVCGVIIAAPRPWKTRATIRPSMLPVRPHQRDDRVNTVRPSM